MGTVQFDAAEVVELARALIRIDTSNPPGNELPGMEYLGAYLERWGIEVEYAEVQPGRPNLFARLRGGASGGHLVFSGHMDVVPAGDVAWEHDPFAADVVADRIVGRGSTDMKGGLAAMAVAMATLARGGFLPAADLVLAVSVGEELFGPGAHHMEATNALAGSGYLVIGEPSGLEVCIAQKGGSRWVVTAHGIAAHASTPHLGASAVSYAARALLALEACPFEFTPHPILGAPTLTVSNMESRGAGNVVPDTCSFTAGVRTVPGMEPDDLDRQMRGVLDDLTRESGGRVTTESEFNRGIPAIETPPDHPLVSATAEAVKAATGRTPVLRGFTGGTDAAVLAPAFDLPFVICGPGRLEMAHQVNEQVAIAELHAAAAAYVGIAQRLLG